MAEDLMGALRIKRRRAMEYTSGLMVAHMLVNGLMVSNMEKVYIQMQEVRVEKAHGTKESARNGLISDEETFFELKEIQKDDFVFAQIL